MKASDLLDIIGEANDEFIHDAKENTKRKTLRMLRWAKWSSAIAACLVIISCISLFSYNSEKNAPAPADNEGSTNNAYGNAYMSYSGPVFPLTIKDDSNGLVASRNINYDFSIYQDQYKMEGDRYEIGDSGRIIIRDTYQIANKTENDMTVTAAYPVVGDFQTLRWPEIHVNDSLVNWKLHAGFYSGSFYGAGDEYSTSLNLQDITSWEQYQELLSDGSYFADAFEDAEELTKPVTVYELTDITSGGSEYEAATLCMNLMFDQDKTQIMTYGFNGSGIKKDTKEEYRDFFIREGRRKEGEETKYLIVVGDDLEGYTLQGYQNGGCTPGEEIEGASATVTREETTIGEILGKIAKTRYDALSGNEFDGDHNRYLNDKISFEMYYQALVKYYATYGMFGTEPKERYELGMLEDIINEIAVQDRIFYLEFNITIPANSVVELNIDQFKEASFDFQYSCSENVGINGYDIVTKLGSNISFSEQTASISNYDAIEIVDQNFGFDVQNGITNITLDLNEPHYWLKMKKDAK